MNKTLLIILLIITTFILPTVTNAACSTRVLKRVCDVCSERALSKLDTDSICPPCKTVNPSSTSLSCITLSSFEKYLKSTYLISSTKRETPLNFTASFIKNPGTPGIFKYNIWDANNKLTVSNNSAFLLYDVVNFSLPIISGNVIFSYNCTGGIDNNSVIKGVCSTIAQDEDGTPSPFGFPFVAVPN